MTDDLSSWEVLIDEAFGQSRALLTYATKAVLAGSADESIVAAAIQLAESWRDLAVAWQDRQSHTLEMNDEEATEDAEVEEALR